ncbi:hypothetical protein KI387_003530, partial [Taxus chinensis]
MTKSQAIRWGSECTAPSAMSTTFVETDSHSFRELVQRLTGVSEGEKLPVTIHARNSSKGREEAGNNSVGNKSRIEMGIQRSAFKFQKRRASQRKSEIKLDLSLTDKNHGGS